MGESSHFVLTPFKILYLVKQPCDVGRNLILLTVHFAATIKPFQHVLNNCETALESGRYTWRHNSVLRCIYLLLDEHLPRSWAISVDLPGLPYVLPSVISNSSLHPDIVLWCQKTKEISLLELTVCFEENFTTSSEYKIIQQFGICL